MVGHDPQRTNRGTSIGPARPRLRFMYRGSCGTPLIGPDGSLFSWCAQGLTALTPTGRQRWAAPLSQTEGGPPVLAPTGLVLANANSGRTTYRHLFVVALSTATGAQRWAVHALTWSTLQGDVPNSKGLAPLVTPTGLLYMPFAGPNHANAGIEVFSPAGQALQRLSPDVVPAAVAVARDGRVYVLGAQGLVALTARGAPRWTQPIVTSGFSGALLVGRQGLIYAGDGAALAACTPDGRVLWRRASRARSAPWPSARMVSCWPWTRQVSPPSIRPAGRCGAGP